jgi:hypothetical protein
MTGIAFVVGSEVSAVAGVAEEVVALNTEAVASDGDALAARLIPVPL